MNHYMDFDPATIRARNDQVRQEVRSLRLEGRLRKSRSPRGSRLSVLAKRGGLKGLIESPRWRAITSILLACAAALTALAYMAPPSQAAGKPDLVVRAALMNFSNTWMFSGEVVQLSFTDKTKNVGSALAGRSQNILGLGENSNPSQILGSARRSVPRLKAGESNKGSGGPKEIRASNSRIGGGYYAVVCADIEKVVAESNEGNNCRYTGKRLSIIPKHWKGTVTGSGTVKPGVTETWTANVDFDFDSYSGGFFVYTDLVADVSYNISGTDSDGCTYSGSGKASIVNGKDELHLFYFFDTYDGTAQISGPVYTITRSCPSGGTTTSDGPAYPVWFYTGAPSPEISNPFGVITLKGQYTSPTTPDGRSGHWEWNLAADSSN